MGHLNGSRKTIFREAKSNLSGEEADLESDSSSARSLFDTLRAPIPRPTPSVFSYEVLKVRRGPLGLCIGTYEPLQCSGEFLKPS